MAFSGEASDDVSGGGGFIKQPGTYHFVITQVFEGQGKKKKDGSRKPVDGFTVEMDALAGSVEGCQGCNHAETFFAPSPTSSEAAQLAKKRAITAFLMATGLLKPEQLGKPFSVDLDNAVEKQVVMKLVKQMEKDGDGNYTVETDFLQLDYASVYHVDDPEVAAVPKNADAIGMIDQADRHDASWFSWKKKSGGGQSQQATAAASAASDLNDII